MRWTFIWILVPAILASIGLRIWHPTVRNLNQPELLSVFCVLFITIWWLAYFGLSGGNLREFLGNRSALRIPQSKLPHHVQLGEAFVNKSRSIAAIVSMLVIMTIFGINLVLREQASLTEYQQLLRPFILSVAAVIFALFLMSIDVLDTVANVFLPPQSTQWNDPVDRELKRLFYQFGIRKAYLAMAGFSVFLALSFSFVYPPATVFFTVAMVWWGCVYWFGEISDAADTAVATLDPVSWILSRLLSVVLLLLLLIKVV